jgi:hypothetical protein
MLRELERWREEDLLSMRKANVASVKCAVPGLHIYDHFTAHTLRRELIHISSAEIWSQQVVLSLHIMLGHIYRALAF